MIKIIKNIRGDISGDLVAEVTIGKSILVELQSGDYIKLLGLIAFLQDLSKAISLTTLQKPASFGLKNNIKEVTLELSY